MRYELGKCPICGRKLELDGSYAVCRKCCYVGDKVVLEPVRTCENLLDDHPCDFECSKCGFSASTVPEGAADWQTTSWSYCPNCGAKVVGECER